jgi:uncharacterized membrane protein (DUF106 family)
MAAKSSSSRLNMFKDSKLSAQNPQETTRLLLDSARLARDTEDIGVRTMEEMKNQREMLEESNEHLDSMKNIAQSAKASIRQIQDRLFRKKFVLWVVIIGLAIANFGLIITLVQNHGSLFYRDDA